MPVCWSASASASASCVVVVVVVVGMDARCWPEMDEDDVRCEESHCTDMRRVLTVVSRADGNASGPGSPKAPSSPGAVTWTLTSTTLGTARELSLDVESSVECVVVLLLALYS